jgi:serine/threonine protein kinase
MTPERYRQIRSLYEAALDREGEERAAFLRTACQGDEDLFEQVNQLIITHDRTGGFLQNPLLTLDFGSEPFPRMEGRQIGAYRVLRELGRGGMGAVYLAARSDESFKRTVAIKVVRPHLDGTAVIRRFRHEREILAALDHPHIARLLDGGSTEEGLPYFVMEYVDGQPIDTWCNERSLTITERLSLFKGVCAAVEYAHTHLVVHLDLKPGNILVTADGTAKLLDFGIAKLLHPAGDIVLAAESVTLPNIMTPDYASPEQVRGGPLGVASDVYSLGVVLYELLTGHRPYRMRSRLLHEVVRVICEEEPTRPSTVVMQTEGSVADGPASAPLTPERVSAVREGDSAKLRRRLEGDLDSILLKALRKEPGERYGSVDQLNEDLRRHLENQPVAARKGTWRYRLARFVRRHRALLLLAGLLATTLCIGVMTTLWQERLALRNARRDLILPQLALYTYAMLAAAGVAIYASRATLRRVAGVFAGAIAFVLTGVFAIRAAFASGWWQWAAIDPSPKIPVPVLIVDALCYAVVLAVISWRVSRRFGWRGQSAFVLIMSVWGPARDYAGAAFNALVTIAPGLAPFVGWATAWCGAILGMQAVMRLVAGPARADRLAGNRDRLRILDVSRTLK